MNSKYFNKATLIAGLSSVLGYTLVVSPANAVENSFEARNTAMGGTGVASSHYGSAPLVNPAMLTNYKDNDDFSLILPSIGASLSDPNDLINKADDISDEYDAFDAAISSRDPARIKSTALVLRNRLEDIKGLHVGATIGASIIAAIPNDTLSFAIVGNSHAFVSGDGDITDHDIAYLDDYISGKSTTLPNTKDLTSSADFHAALVTDLGVSFAHAFDTNGYKWSIGATPKYQRVDLFNYNVSLADFDSDNISDDEYHTNDSAFNLDLGGTFSLNENITFGLAARNVFSKSYETAVVNGLSHTFKVRPELTAGASYSTDLFTLALDADLTPESGFESDDKRQFVSVGGEFNAWGWAQLRAGYRQNVASSVDSAFTAGIGISPFDTFHLDLTGMIGKDNLYGAALQLKLTF